MRAIKFHDEIIKETDGQWHVDLMTELMNREGLDDDAMDVLIGTGVVVFGYMHWDSVKDVLVWSEKPNKYRNTEAVYDAASIGY